MIAKKGTKGCKRNYLFPDERFQFEARVSEVGQDKSIVSWIVSKQVSGQFSCQCQDAGFIKVSG